jgi:hypothetical protein
MQPILYINGQDIAFLVLGIVKDGEWVLRPEQIVATPETFLSVLDSWISQKLVLAKGFSITAVNGPGSPTALRAIASILNALKSTRNVSLAIVQKDPSVPDVDICADVVAASEVPIFIPEYGRDPNITRAPL